jgi:hypothetical protein
VLDGIDGFQIEYSLDSLVGQLLYLHGTFERAEAAFMESRLRRFGGGAVMMDIGANIGLHSLHAARLPEVSQVFAFEPALAPFATLERNILRNGLAGKIVASRLAVGSHTGLAQFHFCADDA